MMPGWHRAELTRRYPACVHDALGELIDAHEPADGLECWQRLRLAVDAAERRGDLPGIVENLVTVVRLMLVDERKRGTR